MKKLLFIALIVALPYFLFPQIFQGTDARNYIKFDKSQNVSVEEALQFVQKDIKTKGTTFDLKSIQKTGEETQVYRYVQTVGSYPVEFSAWNVHVNNGSVTAMNGEIFDNPAAVHSFVISEEAALVAALAYINAEIYMWQSESEENLLKFLKKDSSATFYPTAERVIVPDQLHVKKPTLKSAYKFDIFSLKPYNRKAVYVDAESGNILFSLPLIHFASDTGIAHTMYSGIQPIITEFEYDQYVLRDYTRGLGIVTYNANNAGDYSNLTEFTDDDNVWNNVNASLDQYAVDAHFAASKTYDYFYHVHNRNSINDDGHTLISVVHFNLVASGRPSNVNAFWNGYCMTYGDGDTASGITPLTTVDICGHEITHGLTSYTANLVYANESGALNESFSDIFGKAIEFYAVPSLATWTVGEKIGTVMRSMQDPKKYGKPNTYRGTYWYFGTDDNGGVHNNSSPLNYWFYLLVNGGSGTNDIGNSYSVDSIGWAKAEKLAFKLLTEYLYPTAGYADACFYGLLAAADLFGECSDEVKAVGDAFYAIGVLEEPHVNSAFADFSTALNSSCSAPFTVQFINSSYNCDSFFWEFGDGSTSTEKAPVHTYTQSGFYDVKLTINSAECGSSFILKENYIMIDENVVCETVMKKDQHVTVEGCHGIIYDTGGPHGNYFDDCTSILTIHSPGASGIVLNILEFDIEPGSSYAYCDYDHVAFYNGTSTSSLPINNEYYCNTTGCPETITSSGEYITIKLYADPAANYAGFKIEYFCLGDEMPPSPSFHSDKTISCDGLIRFTDASYNNPTSWLWDFGDGNTSNEQNPVHQYARNGSYHVKLTTTNSHGSNSVIKTNYITLEMPEAPEIGDFISSSDADFDIHLDFFGTVHWYLNIGDETPVHVGNDWTHAPISQERTYYVREIFEEETLHVGPVNNTSAGNFFTSPDANHHLIFDAYQKFVLKSVSVNATGAGNRTIGIRHKGNIIAQKTVSVPHGVSRVELNFEIPEGNNLQIVGLGTPNLFRSDNSAELAYPYVIDDIVSIKSSSASGEALNYYYFFYDWEVSTIPCKSEFTTINLLINSISENDALNQVYIAPNPNTGNFKIIGLENIHQYNIEITNLLGETIYAAKRPVSNEINITNCADGFYFLKVSNSTGQKVIKFVIQKTM